MAKKSGMGLVVWGARKLPGIVFLPPLTPTSYDPPGQIPIISRRTLSSNDLILTTWLTKKDYNNYSDIFFMIGFDMEAFLFLIDVIIFL